MSEVANIQLEGNTYAIKDNTARNGVSNNASNIISLRNRIVKLETKKHMIVIGDSHSTTTYNPANTAWYTIVGKKLNLTVHNYALDGVGYVHPINNKTFSTEVDDAIADESFDNNDVALVIVYGGLNDMTSDYISGMPTACLNLCTKINENFPNAKLVIAGINAGYGALNKVNGSNQIYQFIQMKQACNESGAIFINTSLWLRSTSARNPYYNTNNNHPNVKGNANFATNLLTAMFGTPTIISNTYPNVHDYTATVGSGTLSIYATQNYMWCTGNLTTDNTGKATFEDNYNIFTAFNSPSQQFAVASDGTTGFFNYSGTTLSFIAGSSNANKSYYFKCICPIL